MTGPCSPFESFQMFSNVDDFPNIWYLKYNLDWFIK